MSKKNRWSVLCSIVFALVVFFAVSGWAQEAVSGNPGTAEYKVVNAGLNRCGLSDECFVNFITGECMCLDGTLEK